MTQPEEFDSHAWQRLWEEVRPDGTEHVEMPVLAEYALVLQRHGAAIADEHFPAVGSHLNSNCPGCESELQRLSLAVVEMKATIDDEGLTERFTADAGPDLGDALLLRLGAPLDVTTRRLLVERMGEILDARERSIVQLRLGLLDGRVRTTEEVAKELRVTVERIRRIEERALSKLHQSIQSNQLSETGIE